MAHIGKKFRAAAAKVDIGKRYNVDDAVKALKDSAAARATKFDQTVDVAINLGVDPKHADQMVRGAVVLPHGTGKSKKVVVFAKGDRAKEAEAAGADLVGAEDLAKKIEEGFTDFEATVATPDLMGLVGKLGKVLGPRGLMPNPKVGTVTPDVATAVRNAKAGQVQYRTDKGGIIHASIGRASFKPEQIEVNLRALIEALNKAKPQSSKGIYLRKVALSSTMGVGVKIDPAAFAAAQPA